VNKYISTDSVVAGDVIKYTEGVFGGSWRRPSHVGDRVVVARVLRESYGEGKQQHTFSLEVVESTGCEPIDKGKVIRRKGRNIYRNGVERLKWEDEQLRQGVADEKHSRGDKARAARAYRKETYC